MVLPICLNHSVMTPTWTLGSVDVVNFRRLTIDEYDIAMEDIDCASIYQTISYATECLEYLYAYSKAIWVFPIPPSPYKVHMEIPIECSWGWSALRTASRTSSLP